MASATSILDIPEEVTVMIMRRLGIFDLINFCSIRSEYGEWFYKKSVQKSIGNVTLDQLCEFYAKSETEYEKNLCFHQQVLKRLEICSFNNVVRLYMKEENQHFFSNKKILDFFGSQLISMERNAYFSVRLVGPNSYTLVDDSSQTFWGCCRELLEKIEGDIYLAMDGVDRFLIWDRYDESDFRNRVKYLISFGCESIYSQSVFPNMIYEYRIQTNMHWLKANQRNSVHATRRLISKLTKSNFQKNGWRNGSSKYEGISIYLENLLPVLQARLDLHEHQREPICCNHCMIESHSRQRSQMDRVSGEMQVEPSLTARIALCSRLLENRESYELFDILDILDIIEDDETVKPWPKCTRCMPRIFDF